WPPRRLAGRGRNRHIPPATRPPASRLTLWSNAALGSSGHEGLVRLVVRSRRLAASTKDTAEVRPTPRAAQSQTRAPEQGSGRPVLARRESQRPERTHQRVASTAWRPVTPTGLSATVRQVPYLLLTGHPRCPGLQFGRGTRRMDRSTP